MRRESTPRARGLFWLWGFAGAAALTACGSNGIGQGGGGGTVADASESIDGNTGGGSGDVGRGGTTDAHAPTADLGHTTDQGTGGVTPDQGPLGGKPGTDALPAADAFIPAHDAQVPPADAQVPPADAQVPPTDAGCQPTPEICDGLDNNCDNIVDNVPGQNCACNPGEVQPCYSGPDGTEGVGACLGGTQTCLDDGSTWSACTGETVPADETCDGTDEDCDGVVDDNVPSVGCAVGVGACSASGQAACDPVSHRMVCSALPGAPRAESCNNADDDCDGVTDNVTGLGVGCATGIGACQRSGAVVCDPLNGTTTCNAVAGTPVPELCNGADDNCDGMVDEGDPGAGGPCNTGLAGQCAAGVNNCVNGGLSCTATLQPAPETCNGVDDDCDGRVDNAAVGGPLTQACYEGPAGTEGVGACRAGISACLGGAQGACQTQVLPTDESCNGVDDNCDGIVDNVIGLGDTCALGLGACQSEGTLRCDPVAAGLRCDAQPGAPSPETCNGIDDDCDGNVDNNAPILVAVVGGDFYTDNARAYLDTLPNVTAVNIETCDVATLSQFDAVLLWGNMHCFDVDAFTAYAQGGGGLIATPWIVNNTGSFPALPVSGPSNANFNTALDVTIVDPGSPLLRQVDFTSGDGICAGANVPIDADPDCVGNEGPLTLNPGAHLVANDTAIPGAIALADMQVGLGRSVYLDFHYITSDTSIVAEHAWGKQLLRNAVEDATGCSVGPAPVCPPGQIGPRTEICDGIDNDCDGLVDNVPGVGDECSVGVGQCAAVGHVICDRAGHATVCDGQAGQPGPEVCDGLDNDCDGQSDEDFPDLGQACSVGVGACQANGQRVCNPAGAMAAGLPFSGVQQNVPEATLAANGFRACWRGTYDASTPLADIQAACAGDQLVMACRPVGAAALTLAAAGDRAQIFTDTGVPANPGDVNDDNRGHDHNGVKWYFNSAWSWGFAPAGEPTNLFSCDYNAGAQTVPGLRMCWHTQAGTVASGYRCGDNDLNGDAGWERVVYARPIPATVCNAVAGNPSPDLCDGVDNNCDGTVDENNPGGGPACNTGIPGVCGSGVLACQRGALICNELVQASPEICNGLDDNCNNQADEADPGGGGACNTGLLGQCAVGTAHCRNARLGCFQNQQPSAELCDGIDNNCNGQNDEGNPGGGAACLTGRSGICSPGSVMCTRGSLVCAQNVAQAPAEICGNGLDDNCNGSVDEGCFAQVGQFSVNQGPQWSNAGVVSYSCLEACAMLFGGAAGQYHCSTTNGVLNNRSHVSGWGDAQYCTANTVAENFKAPAGGGAYDCGAVGCSYSAYVTDHCQADAVNYCWR